jgi:hypothetical protein
LGGGVSYSALTSGGQTGSFDPCENPAVTFTQRDPALNFLPWAVHVWEECPTIGSYNVADVYARAADRLERQTSHLVEQTLWTGLLDDGPTATLEALAASVTPSADNIRLASNSVNLIDGGGLHGIVDAFGYIYDYAATVVGGERLWIHVEPRLLPFLRFYGTVTRDSPRSLVTELADHRVVAGSGYTGAGPDSQVTESAGSWIFLTTPIRFFEGPIMPAAGDDAAHLNRQTNRFQVLASRLVLAEWDLTVHAAIKVCLTDPGPACTATGS